MNPKDLTMLATSDLHGHIDELKMAVEAVRPQIVVIAGDVTDKSCKRENRVLSAKTWLELQLLVASPVGRDAHFVCVTGNHDKGSRRIPVAMAMVNSNFHLLDIKHCPTCEICGIKFFGGEKFSLHGKEIRLGNADVLVFHYEPDSREHFVRDDGLQPHLLIFGHKHTSGHQSQVELPPDKLTWINVSSDIAKKNRGYGCYVIQYLARGVPKAVWKSIGE